MRLAGFLGSIAKGRLRLTRLTGLIALLATVVIPIGNAPAAPSETQLPPGAETCVDCHEIGAPGKRETGRHPA